MPRTRATTPRPHSSGSAPDQATMRLEHAGKWLAWAEDERRIVAVGDTAEAVRAAAEQAGCTRFIYDWVPPAEERQTTVLA